MKFISLLVMSFSFNAFSAPSNWVCDKLIACGIYQVAEGNVVHEMLLTPAGASGVLLQFGTIDGQQRLKPGKVWHFRGDGSFTAKVDGVMTSTGICRRNSCAIAAEPTSHNGVPFDQVTVLRFAEKSLQLVKVTVDEDGSVHPSSVVFNKISSR